MHSLQINIPDWDELSIKLTGSQCHCGQTRGLLLPHSCRDSFMGSSLSWMENPLKKQLIGTTFCILWDHGWYLLFHLRKGPQLHLVHVDNMIQDVVLGWILLSFHYRDELTQFVMFGKRPLRSESWCHSQQSTLVSFTGRVGNLKLLLPGWQLLENNCG